jgi:spoIIIJ-associated protein
MRSVEVEGGSIDDAIERALRALGAAREQVEIDILENATRGVLGIGRRRARVRATMRAPFVLGSSAVDGARRDPVRRESPTAAAPTASPATPSASSTAGTASFDGASFLEGILHRMGIPARVRTGALVHGARKLEIDGEDARVVATCRAEVLAAIELLVNRVADRHGRESTRCTIAIAGHEEDDVPRRARRLADRARKSRKPVTIDVADEREQRALTNALQGERGVGVRAVQNESRWQVVIVPEERRRGGKTAGR